MAGRRAVRRSCCDDVRQVARRLALGTALAGAALRRAVRAGRADAVVPDRRGPATPAAGPCARRSSGSALAPLLRSRSGRPSTGSTCSTDASAAGDVRGQPHLAHGHAADPAARCPTRWRRRTAVAAAADYFFDTWWRAAGSALVFNTFPIERRAGAGHRRRGAGCWTRAGTCVVYPEGTRSRTAGSAGSGTARRACAMEHNVPVVPVAMRGTFAAMPRGRGWPVPGAAGDLGPVRPSRCALEDGEDTRAFSHRMQHELARLWDEDATDWWASSSAGRPRAHAGDDRPPRPLAGAACGRPPPAPRAGQRAVAEIGAARMTQDAAARPDRQRLLEEAVRPVRAARYTGHQPGRRGRGGRGPQADAPVLLPHEGGAARGLRRRGGARVAADLSEALEAEASSSRKAEAVIHTLFRLAEEWPEFPQFIREASRLGPEVVERFASTLEPLRLRALAFLSRAWREGLIRRQDPALLLFTLYTAVVGSLTEAGVLRAVVGEDRGRLALRRREREVIQFVRNALAPLPGPDASGGPRHLGLRPSGQARPWTSLEPRPEPNVDWAANPKGRGRHGRRQDLHQLSAVRHRRAHRPRCTTG